MLFEDFSTFFNRKLRMFLTTSMVTPAKKRERFLKPFLFYMGPVFIDTVGSFF